MQLKKNALIVWMIVLVVPLSVSVFSMLSLYPHSVGQENIWAIGIYGGKDPFCIKKLLNVRNPVLSASDVKDVKALFVADPFMFRKDSLWYMFFEVFNTLTKQGDIGLASSHDGLKWEYRQIVLDEPFHLSYPYVFEYNGEIYLIPESAAGKRLCLYQATDFPCKWKLQKTLLEGEYGDHAIIYHNNTWWLFANSEPSRHNTLRLFYADDLFGQWTEHPMSPVIKNDAHHARPGGRLLNLEGKLFRFTQDCNHTYGKELFAFEITSLTKKTYKEIKLAQNPVLKNSGSGWNRHGMHHMDAHLLHDSTWLACVDGYYREIIIKVDY